MLFNSVVIFYLLWWFDFLKQSYLEMCFFKLQNISLFKSVYTFQDSDSNCIFCIRGHICPMIYCNHKSAAFEALNCSLAPIILCCKNLLATYDGVNRFPFLQFFKCCNIFNDLTSMTHIFLNLLQINSYSGLYEMNTVL